MSTVERRAPIAASPAEVWAVLADYGAISAWAPNVDHSCLLTEQTDGEGTVRRIQAGRLTLVETVTEWEAQAVLAYSIEGLPPVLRSVTSSWHLASTGGGTAVTLMTLVDAGPRPPQRAIAAVAGRRMLRASDKMLAGLRRHVEGRSR